MNGFLAFIAKLVALGPRIMAEKGLVLAIAHGVSEILHSNGLVDEAADLKLVTDAGNDADIRKARLDAELGA